MTFFIKRIQTLQDRWKKCVEHNMDYLIWSVPRQLGLQNTPTASLQRVRQHPHNVCPDGEVLMVRFQ